MACIFCLSFSIFSFAIAKTDSLQVVSFDASNLFFAGIFSMKVSNAWSIALHLRSKKNLSRDTGKHPSCMLGLKCGQTKRCKILNAVEKRKKMDKTSEENKNLMSKKGATKYCSWGLCNMDSRYPERMKEGVFFLLDLLNQAT